MEKRYIIIDTGEHRTSGSPQICGQYMIVDTKDRCKISKKGSLKVGYVESGKIIIHADWISEAKRIAQEYNKADTEDIKNKNKRA
jgi:hypothetical protein